MDYEAVAVESCEEIAANDTTHFTDIGVQKKAREMLVTVDETTLDTSSVLYVSLFLILIAFFAVANAQRQNSTDGRDTISQAPTVSNERGENSINPLNPTDTKGSTKTLNVSSFHDDVASLVQDTFPDTTGNLVTVRDVFTIEIPEASFFGSTNRDVPPSRQLFLKRLVALVATMPTQVQIEVIFPGKDGISNRLDRLTSIGWYLGRYANENAGIEISIDPARESQILISFKVDAEKQSQRGEL